MAVWFCTCTQICPTLFCTVKTNVCLSKWISQTSPLLPVQGSWAEANTLAPVSHALAFSEYPSALGCCNPSSLKRFYWLAKAAAAAGLIYGPWVGCRSEVSAAFDGLITSKGGSGTSWQQMKNKKRKRKQSGWPGWSMCGTKKNQEGQPGFCRDGGF